MKRADMGDIIASYPEHGYEVRYNGKQVWKEITDESKFKAWLYEQHRQVIADMSKRGGGEHGF